MITTGLTRKDKLIALFKKAIREDKEINHCSDNLVEFTIKQDGLEKRLLELKFPFLNQEEQPKLIFMSLVEHITEQEAMALREEVYAAMEKKKQERERKTQREDENYLDKLLKEKTY